MPSSSLPPATSAEDPYAFTDHANSQDWPDLLNPDGVQTTTADAEPQTWHEGWLDMTDGEAIDNIADAYQQGWSEADPSTTLMDYDFF